MSIVTWTTVHGSAAVGMCCRKDVGRRDSLKCSPADARFFSIFKPSDWKTDRHSTKLTQQGNDGGEKAETTGKEKKAGRKNVAMERGLYTLPYRIATKEKPVQNQPRDRKYTVT